MLARKPSEDDCHRTEPLPSLPPILPSERLQLSCESSYLSLPELFSTHIVFQDVSLASLYVSTKMHDTLKKPRELLAVSYAVRFPELAAKSKHPGGEVDLDTMDAQV